MTSNYREVISDDALRERILAIEFTARDKPEAGKAAEFKETAFRFRQLAPSLGSLLLRVASESYRELAPMYMAVYDPSDALKVGAELWRRAVERLGAEPPEWALEPARLETDPEAGPDAERELVLETIKSAIIEALRADREALRALTEGAEPVADVLRRYSSLLSWMAPTRDGLAVTRRLLWEMDKRYHGLSFIGGLKGLAERLGWPYRKVFRLNTWCMIIPWDVIEALFSKEEG